MQVLVGGRDDQDVFMVMEFLEHDLKGLLEQGRLKDFGPSDVSVLGLNAGGNLLQTQDTAAGAEVPSRTLGPQPQANQSHLLQFLCSSGHGRRLCKPRLGVAVTSCSEASESGACARDVCHDCLA